MLVEERIDFEVRITISTKMLPNTPTVRTMLTSMMCILYNDIDLDGDDDSDDDFDQHQDVVQHSHS